MTWIFSDGTVVHLGGKVEGESLLAIYLRGGVEGVKSGEGGPRYYPEPLPCESVPVDLDDPRHVDTWLNDAANCMNVHITFAPEVPEVEGEPEPDSDDLTLAH